MKRDSQGRNRHPAGAPKSVGGQYAPDNRRGGAAVPTGVAEPKVDKTVKDIWEACGKCGGTGNIEWGIKAGAVIRYADGSTAERDKRCFRCRGAGGKYVSQQQLERREYDRKRRAERQEEARQERIAEYLAEEARQEEEMRAHRRNFLAQHEGLEDDLETIKDSDFGQDMDRTLSQRGELTERQVEAIRESAATQRRLPPPAPVPESRDTVTGEVLTIKYIENDYGGTIKMLVVDDRGFKVWGSVPRNVLGDEYFDEEADQWKRRHGIERGSRVTFTGTTTPSDNDETFGFFTRPTKAEILPSEPNAQDKSAESSESLDWSEFAGREDTPF